jgi:excisionase family DNA binding protein
MSSDVSSGRLMTPREAAEHLAISTRTLWTLTACGKLPAVRIGRAVRYRPSDLSALCERLAKGGNQ